MKKITLLIGLLLLLSSHGILFAQKDILDVNFDDEDSLGRHFCSFSLFGKGDSYESDVPTLELQYGFAEPKFHKDVFQGKFTNVNTFDARLGFTDFDKVKNSDNILDYKFKYFFLSNSALGLGSNKKEADEIETNTWRFGLSNSTGYGWKLGEFSSIVLYRDDGWLTWTMIDFKDKALDSNSQKAIDYFGDRFRFSEQFQGGVKFRIQKNIAINAGYERILVYPRHLFWKWLGSEIIQGIGDAGLDKFIKEVEKSSPTIAPIVYFVLKNSLSYGIYELRRKSMNWPFESTSPMLFDSFKVGLTFTF
jgi:hypothetical protein